MPAQMASLRIQAALWDAGFGIRLGAMFYFDAHAHLADARLQGRGLEIARQARAAGVAGIVATAARLEEWPEIVRLSQESWLPGALGLHPWLASQAPPDLESRLEQAVREHPGIVAIGEAGLDFWEGRAQEGLQRSALASQIRVARRLDLPIVLHNRRSWPECLEMLRELGGPSLRGLCHSFSGDAAILRQVLDLGLCVSVGGPLLRASNQRLRDLVSKIPPDRLLVESDTPDQPGPGHPEGSRPEQVAEVVRQLAELTRLPLPSLCQQLEENWHSLFRQLPRKASS